MVTTPKKYENALSFTQVSSLAEFVKWVAEIGEQNMLFRGMANAEWDVESSLYRRLKFNEDIDIDNIFLERTQMLIIHASEEGYDIKNGQKLSDLELLVDLQHHGAATCLIDFTKNSFVALCFACESADIKNGKVFALDRDDTNLYNEIKEDTNKEIGYWLTEYEKYEKLWVLSPKRLNNRIASQQSMFVFGSPTLSDKNFHICEITDTKEIREELKKNGISMGMLFDDFVGFAAQNSHNKKYDNLVEVKNSDFISGEIYQKFEDFKSAINYYYKVIKSNPQDSAAYNHRGNAKGKLGEFQGAIRDFHQAIRLNPENWMAYHNCGIAKNKLGMFKDAIKNFDEAIRLNPNDHVAYNNRGVAKQNLGNIQNAISDYDEAIKLNPKYSVAYHNRGIAKSNLNNFQDAISDFDETIKLNPKSHDAYYNRGTAKIYLDNIQEAANDFDEAIRLNPKYYEAYCNRGLTKDKLGKIQEAISDYDETIRLNPKYYEAYYNRGNAKMKSGDIKGAAADFAKAKELNPELKIPDLPLDNSDK